MLGEGWECAHIGEGGLAAGDGAGFVEDDGGEFVGGFECEAAFYEDAVLCAAAGANHDGGGRGEAHGAGAGDDED